MDNPGFSRRNFLSAGSALAVSAVIPSSINNKGDSPAGNSRGLLNVMEFGAKGDGATDDTPAIQKALDTAGKTYGAVFIPEGNFLCSEL
ncbi:MAG TPA: glycoside hydrolase, partial [Bacteroidales bacterium]|nr:glycoside hydrolase [Bacteroidales bacterium]